MSPTPDTCGKTLSQADALYFQSLIVYENSHLLLVYKPHGLPVQKDQSGDKSLLDYGKAYLIERYNKPGNAYLSLPHRIDRPVAGLCLLAKTTKAMQRLSAAFQQKQCLKFYLAIVENRNISDSLPVGSWQELCHYLRKDSQKNKSYVVRASSAQQGKQAKLKYRLLASGKHYSIVAVQLETGRHHQIRCQLAAAGTPIQGDLKYGAKRSNTKRSNTKRSNTKRSKPQQSNGEGGGISLYAFALQVPLPVQASAIAESSRFAWHAKQESDRQASRVLQSICLPWEWHTRTAHTATTSGIWQLCHRNPGVLDTLRSIFSHA
ncbi:MAG: RNA pseudouridine synthase [Spirochaetota bacterium]